MAFVKIKIINSQKKFQTLPCDVPRLFGCPLPATHRLLVLYVCETYVLSRQNVTVPIRPLFSDGRNGKKKAGEMAPSSRINYALRDRSITLRQTPRTCAADGRRSTVRGVPSAVGPYGYVCIEATAFGRGDGQFC